ncbi:MAG: cysteine desulfurase [Ignavibacteriae bacterium]|nr:cysteine desulfurase [Ignavibacteriota bacterium]
MNIPFNSELIRQDFPILHQEIYGKPLVYLDNAATTQKPQIVIDAVSNYYSRYNSNIHRGVHYLSQQATDAYENARKTVQKFINAGSTKEVIFTRGTTEAINLVAASYGRDMLKQGDEIVISTMEHHSNIVPWQMLCEQTGAILRIIPIIDSGEIILEEYQKLLNDRTKIVSVIHVSNSLGTINPVKIMTEMAHEFGAIVLIDGAQAIQHFAVDVQGIGCDFYAFSGHKLYAPTGIGVLYGKRRLLEAMKPYQGGGDMILSVSFEKTTYNELPHKFEAGTPNISGVIGLGAAINYINNIGLDKISEYEDEVLNYGTALLSEIETLHIIGTAKDKSSVLSFSIDGIHPHDIGTFLDRDGIAVRAGHHCTQPLMKRYCVPATTRASISFYNTKAEIDALASSLKKIIRMFE